MYKLYRQVRIYYTHSGLRSPRAHDRDNRQSHSDGKYIFEMKNEYKNRYLLSICANHVLAQQSYTRATTQSSV